MSNKTQNIIFMLIKWTFLIWHHVFVFVWLTWVQNLENYIYLFMITISKTFSYFKWSIYFDTYSLFLQYNSFVLKYTFFLHLTNKNNFNDYLASTPHPWFPCIINDALSHVIKRTSFIWILSSVVSSIITTNV